MAPRRKLFAATIQLEAGNANMAELGKTLGPTGVNLVGIKREYDAKTAAQRGEIVPVVVTVLEDRSFELRYKTPPTSFLIRKAVDANSSTSTLNTAALRAIAQRKLPDLNTTDIEAAMRTVAGTARSMGVTIAGADLPPPRTGR